MVELVEDRWKEYEGRREKLVKRQQRFLSQQMLRTTETWLLSSSIKRCKQKNFRIIVFTWCSECSKTKKGATAAEQPGRHISTFIAMDWVRRASCGACRFLEFLSAWDHANVPVYMSLNETRSYHESIWIDVLVNNRWDGSHMASQIPCTC